MRTSFHHKCIHIERENSNTPHARLLLSVARILLLGPRFSIKSSAQAPLYQSRVPVSIKPVRACIALIELGDSTFRAFTQKVKPIFYIRSRRQYLASFAGLFIASNHTECIFAYTETLYVNLVFHEN